ncbi:hypothetical protein [Natronomonas marina]|jgi:hypothetical protein|uniref:hypothetical protein n=1 Tax=Natronomonas marina TaxID=2961939 RepID=UPI0020C9C6D2|nr:hypothetical protein [Natronomonas marina]
MQTPDTHDAPLVPYTPTTSETTSPTARTDGGSRRDPDRPLDRPPATDHATDYARCSEEIEPFVADLR